MGRCSGGVINSQIFAPAAPSPFLRTQEPCPGTLTPLSTPSLLRWNCPGCTPDPGGHAERRSHCERGRGPHGCGECPELGAEGARLTPVSLRKAKPKGCGTAKTPSPGSQDPSTRESGHPHLGVRTPQPGTVRTPLPGSGPLHPGVRTPPPRTVRTPHLGVRIPPPRSQRPGTVWFCDPGGSGNTVGMNSTL